MKRKLVIAAVAAAALVGGGTYTAVATTGNAAGAPQLTAAQAAAAALKHTPGVVESVDLDDESKGRWEVDVIGRDAREHELGVDAATGTVRAAKDDDGQDDDADDRTERSALRAAKVDAQQAAAAALALQPGTVTSVEFDGRWEVEVHAKDGRDHEVKVDAKTAQASLSGTDDGKDAADDSKDGQKDSKDDKGSKEAKDDHDEGSDD
jgi:uncharacterized membrane protein YkoI